MGYKRKIKGGSCNNSLSNPKKRRTISADKNLSTPLTIFNLPSELVTKILLHVAASSSIDIFNAMLSRKLFNKEANDDYFYQKRSLEKFPLSCWYTDEVISFFKRCEKSGNVEALYRKGMVEYFSFHLRKKSGLEALMKAANAGHLESSYVVGIILVCCEDESSIEEGKRLLTRVKTNQEMKECREKLEEIRRTIWLKQDEDFLKPKKLFDCPFQHNIKRSWNEDEDYLHCEACKWNREISNVCCALSGLSREYY